MATSNLTICLLNWKRPDNLRAVIDALNAQQPRPTIFLWNNSPDAFTYPAGASGAAVDWFVQSTRNVLFAPRWWMASLAETEFVASFDDDLIPTDPTVFADMTAFAAASLPPDRLCGPVGTIFNGRRHYSTQPETQNVSQDTAVDIIKGRCILTRTETIRRTPLGVLRGEDDLNLSGYWSHKRHRARGRMRQHIVPACIAGRFADLPTTQAESYCHREGHNDRRHRAVHRWFRWVRPVESF